MLLFFMSYHNSQASRSLSGAEEKLPICSGAIRVPPPSRTWVDSLEKRIGARSFGRRLKTAIAPQTPKIQFLQTEWSPALRDPQSPFLASAYVGIQHDDA